jgi:hypothetical protein
LLSDGSPEELFGIAAPFAYCSVGSKTLIEKIKTPFVRIPWRNIPQRLIGTKVIVEIANGMSPAEDCTFLYVGAGFDIFVEEFPEDRRTSTFNQPYLSSGFAVFLVKIALGI